jgi:hypothetical protein
MTYEESEAKTYAKRGGWLRTTMNEHEFRRSVFLIVGGLLDADLREVPHINATVA